MKHAVEPQRQQQVMPDSWCRAAASSPSDVRARCVVRLHPARGARRAGARGRQRRGTGWLNREPRIARAR